MQQKMKENSILLFSITKNIKFGHKESVETIVTTNTPPQHSEQIILVIILEY